MTKVIINKFNGGQAKDIRTTRTNQAERVQNYDVNSFENTIIPFRTLVSDTVNSGSFDDYQISDVIHASFVGFVGYGRKSSINGNPKFFKKTAITDTWTHSTEDSSGVYIKNTLVAYKGHAYALRTDAGGTVLLKYDGSSITTVGTITDTFSVELNPRPFVHPSDNILYMVVGFTIAKYDGTTLTEHDSILASQPSYTSLTNYGDYLAIASYSGLNSSVLLWGRDTSLNIMQGSIDFGVGRLLALENINEVLVGVIYPTNLSLSLDNEITVKTWAGGQVNVVAEISTLTYPFGSNLKDKSRNRLYFKVDETNIFSVGQNTDGQWTMVGGNSVAEGGGSVGSVLGFTILDDYYVFCNFNGSTNYSVVRTGTAYNSTQSIFRTTINQGMDLQDRYEDKELTGVYISYSGATTGNLEVYYSVDGSTFEQIISQPNTAGEKYVYTQTQTSNTNSIPLLGGREIRLEIRSTGAVKIKELGYYYNVVGKVNG